MPILTAAEQDLAAKAVSAGDALTAIDLLASILAREEATLLESARLHPLGFLVLTLSEMPDGTAIRLHLWRKTFPQQDPYFPVHTHSWHLTSLVLAGKLVNEVYAVTPGTSNRLWATRYAKGGSEIEPTGELVDVVLEVATEQSAGTVYALDADIFHATSLDSENAASLVLARPAADNSVWVVGPPEGRALRFERSLAPQTLVRQGLSFLTT